MPERPSVGATRPSVAVTVGLGVVAVIELGLVGYAVATGAALLLAVGQTLVLALLSLGVVVTKFRRFRRGYELALARSAAEHERSRLAEELHDVLGHELSLIALRAGALQVTSTGDAAAGAAALRLQVERVVLDLRQTVEMLRSGQAGAAVLEPADVDTRALIERSRTAGVPVTLEGAIGDSVPAPVRLTIHGVVREGVTNAVKHSPGCPVHVRVWQDPHHAHAEVEVEGDADEDPRTWSGLASARDRVEALGGALTVTGVSGRRIMAAEVPMRVPAARTARPLVVRRVGRRPTVATLRWVVPPLAALVAASTAFYSWSTHGATLEQPVFDAIHPGQRVDDVRPVLPPRQAVIRLTPSPPAPAGWRCAYYTDGNFPLGMAAFEICGDGARITRKTDLRKLPLP
jgi:hypothetical protein